MNTVPKLPMRVRTILDEVCRQHNATSSEIYGKKRHPFLVKARKSLIYELHIAGFASAQIAGYLQMHHSTVLYHLGPAVIEEIPCPDLSGEWAI